MRTNPAGLQTLVVAVGALDEVPLRSGKDVNYKPYEVGENDQKDPQHRTIRATGLGVASHPNQDGDLHSNNRHKEDEEEQPATSACRATRHGLSAARPHLRKGRQGGEKDRSH